MSMIYIRGFEDRNLTSPDGVWNTTIEPSNIPGGGYAAMTPGGTGGSLALYVSEMSIDDSPDFTECYIRMYVKIGSLGVGTGSLYWSVIDSSGSDIVKLQGHGVVWISGVDKGWHGGCVIGTSWTRLEFGIKVNSVSGHVIIRVDGETEYSISTDLSAHAAVGCLKMYDNTGVNLVWMDDIVINDTQGARNNSWPGPGHVYGIKPNATGGNSNLTPFPGTGEHNYEDVDETPNDGDTTYVASNLSGNRDTYNFESLGDSGPIRGVAVHTISKLEDGDDLASGIKAVALYGGTYDKKTAPALTTSYTRRGAVFEDDPDGNPWTEAKIDAAEFGVEIEV